MGQPLHVDVGGLRSLGGEVLGQADALRRDVGGFGSRLVPGPGPGVSGWSTFAVLESAGRGWAQFLGGLAWRTAHAGQSLIDAANAYQEADRRAAQRHGGRVGYR